MLSTPGTPAHAARGSDKALICFDKWIFECSSDIFSLAFWRNKRIISFHHFPMIEFSWRARSKTFSNFAEEIFDILIIGGGITGAGLTLDAALRGLRVALVEKRDFASG